MAVSFGSTRVVKAEESGRLASILCPECGQPTVAREDSCLCVACVASREDWSVRLAAHVERYPKVLSFTRCSGCGLVAAGESRRARWIEAEHESEALLAVLLRRAKGALLGKRAASTVEGLSRALGGGQLELREARLVWTEPHSRRVRVEVTVRHASASGAATARTCLLEFVEERRQCERCGSERKSKKMGQGNGDFAAKVQIRAKRVDGGEGGARTLRSLEEFVRARREPATARRVPRGLDVEFESRQAAARFVHDLRRVAPIKLDGTSRKLVTHDERSATAEFQKTSLVHVPPVDKRDLVLVDGTLALVLNVRNSIKLLELPAASRREVSADKFFREPFDPVASAADLLVFDAVDAAHAVRRGDTPPRRCFAPFPCRPGASYLGYDLNVFAHRLRLPRNAPPIVLLLPHHQRDDDDDVVPPDSKSVLSRKDRRKLDKTRRRRRDRADERSADEAGADEGGADEGGADEGRADEGGADEGSADETEAGHVLLAPEVDDQADDDATHDAGGASPAGPPDIFLLASDDSDD